MTQSDPKSHSDIFLIEKLLILSVGPKEGGGVRTMAAISFQHEAEDGEKTALITLG